MKAWRTVRPWAWAAVLAVLVGLAPAAAAQETAVRGKIGYQLGYGYETEELVENALKLELSWERRLGWEGKVYVGFDGRIPATGEQARLKVGEAYADLYLNTTDWRIGRQVINWGTADGFNPTNVVNPRSVLSPAALFSEGALKGEPVLAVQGSYYLPSGWSVTGVGIASYVPAPGGKEMLEAIAARTGALLGGGPLPVAGPDPVPADASQMEWAVRAEGLAGNYNVYVTYFRGWDDYPAAWLEFGPGPWGPVPVGVAAENRRLHKLGLATAGTLKDAGVWAEVSYTMVDELAALDGPGALSSNEGYVEVVVGGDYTFSNGVMVSGQVVYNGGGSLLTPYKEPGAGVEPQTYVAGIVRYSPRVDHNLESVVLANLQDGGILAAGRYTYEVTQAVKLTAGISHVIAGDESEFRQIKDAANLVTAGVEVSF